MPEPMKPQPTPNQDEAAKIKMNREVAAANAAGAKARAIVKVVTTGKRR